MKKHSFNITEDDIILLNGIELPQRNIFEFLENQRIQLANQEKANASLKQQLKNQTQFCDPYCFAGIKKDEEIAELTDKLSDYQQDMEVLAGENEALVKLVIDSFADGYEKAENRQGRNDNAWEYSWTHDELRKITGKEWHELKW